MLGFLGYFFNRSLSSYSPDLTWPGMIWSSVNLVIIVMSFTFLLFILANMLESKSFEVELKDAEPDIIEQLVEFAYTAR